MSLRAAEIHYHAPSLHLRPKSLRRAAMMDGRRLRNLLATLYAGLFVAACAGPGDKLIGSWSEYSQFEYGRVRSEFFKDGTCYFETSGVRRACHWSSLEDGRVKIELGSAGLFEGTSALVALAVVTEDAFLLDTGGGDRSTFVRDGSTKAEGVAAAIAAAVSDREIRIEAEKRAKAEQLEAERTARAKAQEEQRAARAQRFQAEQEAQRSWEAGRRAHREGDLRTAIREFEICIPLYQRLGTPTALSSNALAWIYATSRDPALLNGPRAVELALSATQQSPSEWENWDTLAAAYARVSEFAKAVEAQERAISLGASRASHDRLASYRQQETYVAQTAATW